MLLRARVNQALDPPLTALGTIVDGRITADKEVPHPAHVLLEEADGAWYLHYLDEFGADYADYWFQSLLEAFEAARSWFAIQRDDWLEVTHQKQGLPIKP